MDDIRRKIDEIQKSNSLISSNDDIVAFIEKQYDEKIEHIKDEDPNIYPMY